MMKLTSPAFEDGARIPARYTCDGDDISPPLRWTEAPEATQAFLLLVTDPDDRDFVHWLLNDIPAHVSELPEGTGDQVGTPVLNGFGQAGWGGPCPATGIHQYLFTLHALSAPVRLPEWPDRDAVDGAIAKRVIEAAQLRAVFKHDRPGNVPVGSFAGRSDVRG
jgi:Raf kinase inhibitor-like YbhB/YbcL family protein